MSLNVFLDIRQILGRAAQIAVEVVTLPKNRATSAHT